MTPKTTARQVARNVAREQQNPRLGSSATNRVYKKYLPNIQKRSGAIVPFEFSKIVAAIEKSMKASNEGSFEEAVVVAHPTVTASASTTTNANRLRPL